MRTKTWNNTIFTQIPDSGDVNWPLLTNFLVALADNAQTTNFQKTAIRVATSSPVTVASATDHIIVAKLTVPGAVAITLPAGVNGQQFYIVDGTGDAATNNITITPSGGQTIGGAGTLVISENGATRILSYDSVNTNWIVVGGFQSSGLTRTSTDQGANRVKNKDFDDATTAIVDDGDTTKKVVFQVSGAATGAITTISSSSTTSRTITTPDVTSTLLARTSTDQGASRVQNKDLDDSTTKVVNASDTTKKLAFDVSGNSTGITTTLAPTSTGAATLSLPPATSTLVSRLSTDTGANRLTNKDLDDATTNIVDDGDTTKKINFQASGSTTGTVTTIASSSTTSKTLTLPNITDTIITKTSSDTGSGRVKNKDLDDATTQIVDTSDTTKVIKFDAGGTTGTSTTITSAQTANRILTIPDVTDTLAAIAATQQFTNKDYDGGTASNSLRMTIPKNTATNLTALTRKQGTLVYDTTNNVLKYDDGSALNTIGSASTATATTTGLVTSYNPIVASGVSTVSSANATMTQNDGFDVYLFSTGASNRTFTLAAVGSSTGRIAKIKKTDNSAGRVVITPASGTIDGAATYSIWGQNEEITITCDGTNWFIIGYMPSNWISFTPASATWSANFSPQTSYWRKVHKTMELSGAINQTGAATAAALSITLPVNATVDSAVANPDNGAVNFGDPYGYCFVDDSSTGDDYMGLVVTAHSVNDTSIRFQCPISSANFRLTPITQANPMTWANGDSLSFKAFIPIVTT